MTRHQPRHTLPLRRTGLGFTDAQIVEIIALFAVNSFTNYLNEVAKTNIDFPVVLAAEAA